ncbi:MAG: hypothetical protein JJU26_04430, partial [Oceanicaulis sp.]|nr:hypothetical protein [Oceanicaulis sp.]
MKIRLLGDHSRYHCGSKAVWEVLSREAARHGTLVSDDSFDLLVVNGEGSMHHGSAGCHRKIEAISEALGSGRRAMLINTVWQDNPPGLASVLTGCERVTARELMSARVLEAEGVRADLCLDLSYYRPIDPAEPHDFGGGVVMTDFWSNEFDTFAKVTGKWAARHAYVDMQDWDW